MGDTPYQHLKTKMLGRLMLSDRARLQQLLAAEDPDDRRPTYLLRRIRQLLGEHDVPSHTSFLRELFLNHLPKPIRLVLPPAGDVTLDRLTELADRVHEVASPSVSGDPLASSQPSRPFTGLSCSEYQPSVSMLAPPPLLAACHKVHISLFIVGQRPMISLTAASDRPCRRGRLFMITDKLSGIRSLIDTGAEISGVPPTKADRSKSTGRKLRAANKSSISTYGLRSLFLDLGLCRTFLWVFVIADVVHAIIGCSDFFFYFDLDFGARHHRFTDGLTRLSISGVLSGLAPIGICPLIPPSSPF
ncbi:uncharacterized protein LOC144107388 [Amblyomma americanum]